jgi:hypothetical protein
MASTTTKLTTKQAITKVLAGKRKRMTVAQTFYSVLYSEAKKPNGLVVKAGNGGLFKLNPKRARAAAKA